MKIKTVLFIFVFVILSFSLGSFAYGQSLGQIALNLEIEDEAVSTGMLISAEEDKYLLSSTEYDPKLYGVVVSSPALTLNIPSEKTRSVVTNGQALVLVSLKNGTIKAGDLITTSNDKGIGQKSTRSGHVLGKALSDFPTENANEDTGLIPVLINITYSQVSTQAEGLTDAGVDQVVEKISGAFLTGNFADILKYVFAVVLGAISFFLGLSHFVRSNQTAVEAIARNPMAKSDIQRQLVFGNVGILIVSGIGLFISLGILFFL